MSGLKIGNQDIVHLRLSYPEPKPEGDALWNWYKYASDAGGYFVRGLWFAPCYNNGWIYWWPWDLGVTGGALKDLNNGAHYWGYIQDGRNKNITKGMTKNFAANGWKNEPWDEAITLWGNESNFTDDKGKACLDFGDHPIVIHFLDGRFDDSEFIVDTSHGSIAEISQDKRTVTINRVGSNHIAVVIKPKIRTIDQVRLEMQNVLVSVDGLDYHTKQFTPPIDKTKSECYNAYIGENLVYHKVKDLDNLIYHGIVDTVVRDWPTGVKSIIHKCNGSYMPVLDNMEGLVKYSYNTESKVEAVEYVQFTGRMWNDAFVQQLKEYCKTKVFSNYTVFTTGDANPDDAWFKDNTDMKGHWTFNFDIEFMAGGYAWSGTNIDELTFNNTSPVSSMHRMFGGMHEVRHIHMNKVAWARDLSAAFEQCNNLLELPSIHWSAAHMNDETRAYRSTNIGWFCDYCFKITEIPQYGTDRFADDNLLIVEFMPQAFESCNNLVKIGPVLDMRYVKPEGINIKNAFNGCDKLTDVRIQRLNHGNWDFSSWLPALDADSIAYLIDNLTDLTIEKGDDDASTSLVRSATLKKNAMWTISDEQKAAALAKGWTII